MTACVLLAATPATAFDNGAYKGTHSQGSALTFKVVSKVTRKQGKKVVRRIVRLRGPFTNVDVTCPDGFVYHAQVSSTDANGPINTDIPLHGGSFAMTKATAPLRFTGRLVGKGRKSHASGKLVYRFEVQQHGGDCTSGTLSWTARHG